MSSPSHPKSRKDSLLHKNSELAADIIRRKLTAIYNKEPDATTEQSEAELVQPRSKHQEFMHTLAHSGKSLAQIQTDWHQYYVNLPDDEKHQVWQEFYENYNRSSHALLQPQAAPAPVIATPQIDQSQPPKARPTPRPSETKSYSDIKSQIIKKVAVRGKLSKKHHVQSIAFGLGTGAIVMVIMLFGFFNEQFIAPFITPSRTVSNTPIIADPNSIVASGGPEVIIPKINVEIPVVYDQPSIEEHAIQSSLENGVVHYATTPAPGEKGNAVIFGHSSNNILNKGKYKFAFVLLKRLEVGDTFMLTKDGKRYSYKVYDRKIVKPEDVSVLGATDKTATATLITCDPPGTSLNRLVVTGEQISPDPNGNATSTAKAPNTAPTTVPGNAPSLWSRLTSWAH
jgi:LPXTG-site transpeptidase (sortase) family protein